MTFLSQFTSRSVGRLLDRYRALALVSACYLLLNFLFRIVLISTSSVDNVPLAYLAESTLVGAFYDIVFVVYFMFLPFIIDSLIAHKNTIFRRILSAFLYTSAFSGLIFLFISEWFFWEEFTSRFNFVSVDYLIYRHEVSNNILESYPVPLLLSICLIVAIVFSFGATRSSHRRVAEYGIGRRVSAIAIYGLTVLSCVYFVGQDTKEISKNRIVNEIAANGPYQFFAAFRNNELDFDTFYAKVSDDKANDVLKDHLKIVSQDELYSTQHHVRTDADNKSLNVMFVVIESLSADFLGSFGNLNNLTPNLDALAKDSIFFDALYATGSRTTRGLESLTLSLPPSPGRSLVKRPKQDSLYNIGTELRRRDYNTNFFYDGRGYFDNMNEFFSANGFKVIDQTDFNEDEIGFKNAWGLADEYLYKRVLREADNSYKKSEKFFNFVLTTSNHRPYTFPKNRIDLPTGSRSAAVKYTDWAIGNFISEAKEKPWFNDTVFVFVADHCASSAGRENLNVQKHHIPWLVYSPTNIKAQHIVRTVSQIDVAPTLLSLLGMDYDSRFLGIDALKEDNVRNEGLAFIANYQFLGLYEDGELTYLKPKKAISHNPNPLNNQIEEILNVSDSRAERTISFYQATDRIIHDGLNIVQK